MSLFFILISVTSVKFPVVSISGEKNMTNTSIFSEKSPLGVKNSQNCHF